MTEFDKNSLDNALLDFTKRNFVKPEECKNPEQAQYYTQELKLKLEDYRIRFRYVPEWAMNLQLQYQSVQDSLATKKLTMLT